MTLHEHHYEPSPPGAVIINTGAPNSGGSHSGGGSSGGSSSGGSHYSSGGSRSSGSSAPAVNPYIASYKEVYINLGIKPNMAFIKKYAGKKYSTSTFLALVRRHDPRYMRSEPAKQQASDFRKYWKGLFPDRKVNVKLARRFIRGDLNQAQLDQMMLRSKAGRQDYGYYKGFRQAQGTQANLANYQAYRLAMENIFDQYGAVPATKPGDKGASNAVPRDWSRAFFKSGMTPAELAANMKELYAGRGAVTWQQGAPLTGQQEMATMFNQRGAERIRQELARATSIQKSYMQSQNAGYETQKTQSGLVTQAL